MLIEPGGDFKAFPCSLEAYEDWRGESKNGLPIRPSSEAQPWPYSADESESRSVWVVVWAGHSCV